MTAAIADRLASLGLVERPELDGCRGYDLRYYGAKWTPERAVNDLLASYRGRTGQEPRCFRVDGSLLLLAGAR